MREARTSFTDIAEECGISVCAARNRYTVLKEAGIINGEIMQVNPYALGYNCICDIGITSSIKSEKNLIQTVNNSMGKIIGPWGRFNIKLLVVRKSINDLPKILQELESDCRTRTVDTFIWSEAVNVDHPENLTLTPLAFDDADKNRNRLIETIGDDGEIDEKDRQIAKILSQNARTPFREIGERIDFSTASVAKRYKKLRKNLLARSTITVNLNNLGYNALAHTLIKASSKNKIPEIHKELLKIPDLIVAIKLIGPSDFLTISAIRDFNEFFRIKNQIRLIDDVEREETFLWKTFKRWPANLFTSLL